MTEQQFELTTLHLFTTSGIPELKFAVPDGIVTRRYDGKPSEYMWQHQVIFAFVHIITIIIMKNHLHMHPQCSVLTQNW